MIAASTIQEVREQVAEAMFQEAPPPWERPEISSFTAYAVGTILLSVVFFVVIPVCIYTASYFPYAVARGNEAGFWGMAQQALSWPCHSTWRRWPSPWRAGPTGGSLR